jgi:hypothetical protein
VSASVPTEETTVDLAATPNTILNTAGITTLEDGLLVIVALSVAITAMTAAHKSNIAKVLTAVIIVAVGAMISGLASAGLIPSLGAAMVHLFLKLT